MLSAAEDACNKHPLAACGPAANTTPAAATSCFPANCGPAAFLPTVVPSRLCNHSLSLLALWLLPQLCLQLASTATTGGYVDRYINFVDIRITMVHLIGSALCSLLLSSHPPQVDLLQRHVIQHHFNPPGLLLGSHSMLMRAMALARDAKVRWSIKGSTRKLLVHACARGWWGAAGAGQTVSH